MHRLILYQIEILPHLPTIVLSCELQRLPSKWLEWPVSLQLPQQTVAQSPGWDDCFTIPLTSKSQNERAIKNA